MIYHFGALCLGFILDLILGDPPWLRHPVRGIGMLIGFLEKPLRSAFPKSERGELTAGGVLAFLTLLIPTALTVILLMLCGRFSIYLAFAAETILCFQLLATKSLRDESMKVYRVLGKNDLPGARKAVSMIVGRDTENLDEAGVAKAAVETVAENFSDGVLAPMLFMMLGGAPLGMFYKAANTMDSMVGYKNDNYLFFGRAAARFDDLVNIIPSRLAGIIMCLAAFLVGLDGKNAFRIFFRDRRNHKSPNSAHTEAAAAGALHVRLAGDNTYFGKLVHKPTIGDDDRPIERRDIVRINRLMVASALLAMLPVFLILIFLILR